MAVFPYRKFKISLAPNSSKLQGLRVGDIVRRQYFDNQLERNDDGSYSGKNVGTIYSLMCVLEVGIDLIPQFDSENNPIYDNQGVQLEFQQPWFIGALLDGAVPKDGELLDFVRITSLYDTNRSGALYLTASDDMAPFMDVIDGIGHDASLCWPEDICRSENPDHETQYVLQGSVVGEYLQSDGTSRNRIVHIKKQAGTASFTGLTQDFYKYVSNPNMILVSYWAKASAPVSANVSLGYINGAQTDGDVDVVYDTEWKYYFHSIIVDWSGRHLRTVKVNLGGMKTDEEVWISDFNVILLSSVANFKDASKIRVGRLDGVVDPVFGRLDGYGGYLQKLFASQSAHISGTLTAGDENGFGSSFYAGKIHKNCLINSIGLNTVGGVIFAGADDPKSPTGIGSTIKMSIPTSLVVQTNDWLNELEEDGRYKHIGRNYTFSFWVYSKKPCVLDILQNGQSVGAAYINVLQTHTWTRIHKTFELAELDDKNKGQDLILTIAPIFKSVTDPEFGSEFKDNQFTQSDDIAKDTLVADENIMLFTSPQLESGTMATQYQPTDEHLNYTDDYGAWFDRGGIGGTIQNPLLRLNYDGTGAIDTRTRAFRLNQDGSGFLAKENIKWDENGKVTFGKDVSLNWDNLDKDAQDEMANRYMRILGQDTFTIIGQEDSVTGKTCSPSSITMTLDEVGFKSASSQRQWSLLIGNEWVEIPGANGLTLEVFPDSCYWLGYVTPPPSTDADGNPIVYHGESRVSFRCVVTLNDSRTYTDTFNITKQYVQGYTVQITSSKGNAFQNGECSTVLTATVYYQGQPVSLDYALEHFTFTWHRYKIDDLTTDLGFDDLDTTDGANVLTLKYDMDSSDVFVCELGLADHFDYSFPVIF